MQTNAPREKSANASPTLVFGACFSAFVFVPHFGQQGGCANNQVTSVASQFESNNIELNLNLITLYLYIVPLEQNYIYIYICVKLFIREFFF